MQSADLGQTFGQASLILVIVEIGGVQQQGGLLADRFHQTRMRMPQRINADARQQIQVALSGQIINVTAAAMMQREWIACIVLQKILALERPDLIERVGLRKSLCNGCHVPMIT